MKDLEFNKIAAAVLVAGLVAMLSGTLADMFYHPHDAKKRGYVVEGVTIGGEAAAEPVELNIPLLLAQADAAKGKKVCKKCVSCHTFEQSGKNGIGPNLWGILGAKQARDGSFAYTDAIKNLGGNWDVDNLHAFLNNPKAYAKGTKMNFPGLKKPQQIADLMAYMKQQSSPNFAFPEVEIPIEEPVEVLEGEPTNTPAEATPETVEKPDAEDSSHINIDPILKSATVKAGIKIEQKLDHELQEIIEKEDIAILTQDPIVNSKE